MTVTRAGNVRAVDKVWREFEVLRRDQDFPASLDFRGFQGDIWRRFAVADLTDVTDTEKSVVGSVTFGLRRDNPSASGERSGMRKG